MCREMNRRTSDGRTSRRKYLHGNRQSTCQLAGGGRKHRHPITGKIFRHWQRLVKWKAAVSLNQQQRQSKVGERSEGGANSFPSVVGTQLRVRGDSTSCGGLIPPTLSLAAYGRPQQLGHIWISRVALSRHRAWAKPVTFQPQNHRRAFTNWRYLYESANGISTSEYTFDLRRLTRFHFYPGVFFAGKPHTPCRQHRLLGNETAVADRTWPFSANSTMQYTLTPSIP